MLLQHLLDHLQLEQQGGRLARRPLPIAVGMIDQNRADRPSLPFLNRSDHDIPEKIEIGVGTDFNAFDFLVIFKRAKIQAHF